MSQWASNGQYEIILEEHSENQTQICEINVGIWMMVIFLLVFTEVFFLER